MRTLLRALLAATLLALPVTPILADDSPFVGMPLIQLMGKLEYFTHKVGLAIDADNPPLQDFYAHEIEEILEALAKIEEYEAIPISNLVKVTFEKKFEALEEAIDSEEDDRSEQVNARYDDLLGACNLCHRAASRPFIVVKRNPENFYPQSFAPVP